MNSPSPELVWKVSNAEQQEVAGILASESLDRDGEVFDYDKSKKYFQAWSQSIHAVTSKIAGEENASFGNVRLMHGKQTVGKLVDIKFDDVKKTVWGIAKVTDSKTWEDIKNGVYSAFSIGAKLVSSVMKSGKRWLTVNPMEVSIVDYPANGDAVFQWAKSLWAEVAKGAEGVDVLVSEKGIMTKTAQASSFDAIRNRVEAALCKKYGTENSWVWIRDMFAASVVFTFNCNSKGPGAGDYTAPVTSLKGGDCYECSYTDDGTVATLGEPAQVTVSYAPVAKAAAMEPAAVPAQDGSKSAPKGNDIPGWTGSQAVEKISPPGWEGTVQHMKEHSEIDNPWALAWWMDEQGYTSHKSAYSDKESISALWTAFKLLTPREQISYYLLSERKIKF